MLIAMGQCNGTLSDLGYPHGRKTLVTVFRAVEDHPGLGPVPANLRTGQGKEGAGGQLMRRGHDPL